jgi:hypothetical protein
LKSKALGSLSIFELTVRFERTASLYGEAYEACDSKRANKQHDVLVSIRQELRQRGAEGRAAILSLMRSNDRGVRLCAAAIALRFAPEQAEPVLKELAVGLGTISFTAEVTLEEWREGNLGREDWS